MIDNPTINELARNITEANADALKAIKGIRCREAKYVRRAIAESNKHAQELIERSKLVGRELVPVQPTHRTRFFVEYAKTEGVRMSALLLLVAACTKRKEGKWHQTAEWFGRMLGVSRPQALNLLNQAKARRLITHQRTARGILVKLTSTRPYMLLFQRWEGDIKVIGYYDLRLARIFGPERSVVYSLLRAMHKDDPDRSFDHVAVSHCLPWLTPDSARKHLKKLLDLGVIGRKKTTTGRNCGAQAEFNYFWQKRTPASRSLSTLDRSKNLSGTLDHSGGTLDHSAGRFDHSGGTLDHSKEPYISLKPSLALADARLATLQKPKGNLAESPCGDIDACGGVFDFDFMKPQKGTSNESRIVTAATFDAAFKRVMAEIQEEAEDRYVRQVLRTGVLVLPAEEEEYIIPADY